MELTILGILDETPKGLTTGFRLKLTCQGPSGPSFVLDLPILVSREVMEQAIPLPLLVFRYLERNGLDAWPDLFVDTRRLDLTGLGATEPAYPHKLPLGGPELLNQRVLDRLAAKKP